MQKKIILLDGGMGQGLIKNSKSDPHRFGQHTLC